MLSVSLRFYVLSAVTKDFGANKSRSNNFANTWDTVQQMVSCDYCDTFPPKENIANISAGEWP